MENNAFRFVVDPSLEHLTKMAKSMDIYCTIVKFLKVTIPGYGIVYTMHTPGSVAKQQLYEVTISDFPACKCLDFISIKSYTLRNSQKKWTYHKHIYFILQWFMGCTSSFIALLTLLTRLLCSWIEQTPWAPMTEVGCVLSLRVQFPISISRLILFSAICTLHYNSRFLRIINATFYSHVLLSFRMRQLIKHGLDWICTI